MLRQKVVKAGVTQGDPGLNNKHKRKQTQINTREKDDSAGTEDISDWTLKELGGFLSLKDARTWSTLL